MTAPRFVPLLVCVTALASALPGAHRAARASGDYDPKTLFQLMVEADVIVAGIISQVNAETYVVDVTDDYGRAAAPERLTISRRDDLLHRKRAWDYDTGVPLVLFAMGAAADESPLSPIGLAGEGEVPERGEAYYFAMIRNGGYPLASSNENGGSVTGFRVERATFAETARGFFRCFAIDGGAGADDERRLVRRCDAAAMADFADASPLAAHLVDLAIRTIERDR